RPSAGATFFRRYAAEERVDNRTSVFGREIFSFSISPVVRSLLPMQTIPILPKKYGRDNGNVFRRHQRQANRCRSNHSAGGTLFVRASVGIAGKPKGFVHAELFVDACGNDRRQRSALRMVAVTSCASRRTQRIDDEGPEL